MSTDTPDDTLVIMSNFRWYYTPVLICLATIGNFLCVLVPFRTKMRDTISLYYFIALAINNEASIVVLLIDWIIGLVPVDRSESGYCRAGPYLRQVFPYMSAWFIVALMVDRFQAVGYRSRRRALCTRRTAMMIIAGLMCLGLVEAIPALFIFDSHCGLNANWWYWWLVNFSAHVFIASYLPFVIIVVLSIRIFKTIGEPATMGRILTNPTANGTNDGSTGQESSSASSAKQTLITKMLVIVAIVYISMRLPALLVYAVLGSVNLSLEARPNLMAAYQFFSLCSITSYGITFFVCCAVNRDFRQAALATILCRRRIHPPVSQTIQYPCANPLDNASTLTPSHGHCTAPQGSSNLEMEPNANAEMRAHSNDENP